MISVKDITIMYPNKRGIFNISFEVKKGEVLGYLGPNGAGKTTTLRAIMGLMKVNTGSCTINNMDCFKDSSKIMKNLGYIPGEIVFMDDMKCMDFLYYQCELRNISDYTLMNKLIKRFELNTNSKIKECSKGMKQKLGIITAFMHDPDILILDEPTSGLDPLMQNEFIKLVEEEKKKGKTILISSHMFEEIERTCSKVIIIKNGHIKANTDIEKLKKTERTCFKIETPDMEKLKKMEYEIEFITDNTCLVYIQANEVDSFIKNISKITISKLEIKKQTLEDAFLHFYEMEDL